jgi:hypothetical protein
MTAPTSALRPAYMNIYWRNEYANPAMDTTFPEDLSMVAGNADAATPQSIWIVNFQCVAPDVLDKPQGPGRYQSVIPPYCDLPEHDVCPTEAGVTFPDNCAPVYLRMVITFPECVKLSGLNTAQGMVTPITTWYGVTNSPTPAPPNKHDPSSYINCPFSVSPWLQIPNIQMDPHWRLNNHMNSPAVSISENTTDPPQGQDTWTCSSMTPCMPGPRQSRISAGQE